MNIKSTAKKNVLILILSLLPFIIGLSYSVYKSSDKAYLSSAINISGSQRMRTMLISNYSQNYYYSEENSEAESDKELLIKEVKLYMDYYNALVNGDQNLELKENKFEQIKASLTAIGVQLEAYSLSVNKLVENKNDLVALDNIRNSAMTLKNAFHEITEMYQKENDKLIRVQKIIDIIMILFGITVTVVGLFLTIKIKQQEYHATYDYLTGLKNRHSFYDFAKESTPKHFSILFIDLNKFKYINDTYGHEIGDEILIEVSMRLKNILGAQYLFRFGGDEFIGLISSKGISAEEVERKIDAIVNEIKQSMSCEIIDSYERSHYLGLAMGVVSSNVEINEWQNLINLADDLMYDSKNIPGHTIIYKDPEQVQRRKKFLKSFEKAFDRKLFKLHLQDIHSIGHSVYQLVNVTSKWIDEQTEFTASEFMPALKRKGYVMELDLHSLRHLKDDIIENNNSHTCQNKKFMFSIAEETLVNIQNNGVYALLIEKSFPKEHLILKIQEDYLNNPKVISQLELIKNLGCWVAIDHFNLVIDFAFIEKSQHISLLKIDHISLNALLDDEKSTTLLIEFIAFILKSDKIIILEGIDHSKINKIKSRINEALHHKLFYSLKY